MTWGTGITMTSEAMHHNEAKALDRTESKRLQAEAALRARRQATWRREIALLQAAKKKGGEG